MAITCSTPPNIPLVLFPCCSGLKPPTRYLFQPSSQTKLIRLVLTRISLDESNTISRKTCMIIAVIHTTEVRKQFRLELIRTHDFFKTGATELSRAIKSFGSWSHCER